MQLKYFLTTLQTTLLIIKYLCSPLPIIIYCLYHHVLQYKMSFYKNVTFILRLDFLWVNLNLNSFGKSGSKDSVVFSSQYIFSLFRCINYTLNYGGFDFIVMLPGLWLEKFSIYTASINSEVYAIYIVCAFSLKNQIFFQALIGSFVVVVVVVELIYSIITA